MENGGWVGSITQSIFISDEIAEIFSAKSQLQGMLEFEAALARAEARAGIMSHKLAAAICTKCDANLFDLGELAVAASRLGNPAIPMVSRLTLLVGATDPEAARYVHWGATSQDVMDTGNVLQMRRALRLLLQRSDLLATALAELAEKHRDTDMVGRTLMQHAVPTTFGLKAVGWLAAIERHIERLGNIEHRVNVLQFGGAAGTLASLGDCAMPVSELLAKELELGLPEMPWHSHRDGIGEIGMTLALLVGTLGKIAKDVSLLMQTEVGEVFEMQREVGSFTMPQKHNPVGAIAILAAAHHAQALAASLIGSMVQEHERAVGGWAAEWLALPMLFQVTGGALERAIEMVAGLRIDAGRMRENLLITRGAIMAEPVALAMSRRIGRTAALDLVRKACIQSELEARSLRSVLDENPVVMVEMKSEELDHLLDPANYRGLSDVYIDRVLQKRRSRLIGNNSEFLNSVSSYQNGHGSRAFIEPSFHAPDCANGQVQREAESK